MAEARIYKDGSVATLHSQHDAEEI